LVSNSENWQDYPYLVEWVARMNEWVGEYQIYEFIPADETGQDPSGRVPNSLVTSHENQGKIEERFIWTLEDNGNPDGRLITTEFSTGIWRVRGWYLGRIPHEGLEFSYEAGKLACNQCEGQGFFENAEGDEVDCELCESGETSKFFELEDTSFRIGS
jgi:hypothetical protein